MLHLYLKAHVVIFISSDMQQNASARIKHMRRHVCECIHMCVMVVNS